MSKNYQRSDIKTPKNRFEFKRKPVGLNSNLTTFQRMCYNLQLAEHRFEPSDPNLKIWVEDADEYESLRREFEEIIEYLLDEKINLNFIDDNFPESHEQKRFLDLNFEYLSLFSGGLDSTSLPFHKDFRKKTGILHHTITHNIIYGKARRIFNNFLKNERKTTLVTSLGQNRVRNPSYLKTRGLVFLTNALCIASELKIPQVIIPENGPFMINLPISPNSDPTRTADPIMIEEWTKIFNKLTNSNVKIRTPFLNKTKSEVILSSGKKELLPETWSCSYFQGLSKMCGMCNSCLVRILSCYAIEEGEKIENYYNDNPFTIKDSSLKEGKLESYRITLDAIDFWESIINPDSLSKINRQRYLGIVIEYPIMIKHAVDMFLGFQNLSKKYSSKQPIFIKFSKKLNYIDKKILHSRRDELFKMKQCEGWS